MCPCCVSFGNLSCWIFCRDPSVLSVTPFTPQVGVLQPIDFLIDAAFDVTDVVVQQAIGKVLPECHLVSAAIDCSTKSRIREIKLSGGRGPRPLRSTQFPRGLPQLAVHEASRVASDNACSDFLLAVQHVLAEHGRGAFRENPSNSLHWDDPVEQVLNRSGDWADFHYFACVFLAPRKKSQIIRHNLKHMRQLLLPVWALAFAWGVGPRPGRRSPLLPQQGGGRVLGQPLLHVGGCCLPLGG